MRTRWIARTAAAVLVVGALFNSEIGIGTAGAEPCPDIEVVFARGTAEPPGTGGIGQAFVRSLRSKVDGRSVGVYAVNYPAGFDFYTSASAGAQDARAHVQHIAANCPATRLVLGGMSQGAAVIDLITLGGVAVPSGLVPAPMPPEVAGHVAAIAVFGNPSRDVRGLGPLTAISPLYGEKTIDLCAPGDPFCSDGNNLMAHGSYVRNGMVDQAASFAASRL